MYDSLSFFDSLSTGWDLEYNKVVRHYHGHLSGVFDLKIHPTLDLIVTGGRDSVARVAGAILSIKESSSFPGVGYPNQTRNPYLGGPQRSCWNCGN